MDDGLDPAADTLEFVVSYAVAHVVSFWRRSISSICPDRTFDRAASKSNHSARSTSGKAWRLPLPGGHSISKVLLDSDVVSKSASPQKTMTRFPPRWRISPKACTEPIEAAGPSSSAN